jgi:ABC-type antimicrobial peptide transport system permease subunit
VLSGVGIYAALAFSMRQRTAEIGVRMALGADARDIAGLIARHALLILAIGWLIGGLATAGLTRYIRSDHCCSMSPPATRQRLSPLHSSLRPLL